MGQDVVDGVGTGPVLISRDSAGMSLQLLEHSPAGAGGHRRQPGILSEQIRIRRIAEDHVVARSAVDNVVAGMIGKHSATAERSDNLRHLTGARHIVGAVTRRALDLAQRRKRCPREIDTHGLDLEACPEDIGNFVGTVRTEDLVDCCSSAAAASVDDSVAVRIDVAVRRAVRHKHNSVEVRTRKRPGAQRHILQSHRTGTGRKRHFDVIDELSGVSVRPLHVHRLRTAGQRQGSCFGRRFTHKMDGVGERGRSSAPVEGHLRGRHVFRSVEGTYTGRVIISGSAAVKVREGTEIDAQQLARLYGGIAAPAFDTPARRGAIHVNEFAGLRSVSGPG